jgi:hypothetical protein
LDLTYRFKLLKALFFCFFLFFGLETLKGLDPLELKFVGEVDGGLLDKFVE